MYDDKINGRKGKRKGRHFANRFNQSIQFESEKRERGEKSFLIARQNRGEGGGVLFQADD